MKGLFLQVYQTLRFSTGCEKVFRVKVAEAFT